MPTVFAIGEALIEALAATSVTNGSGSQHFNVQSGGSAVNFCRFLKRVGTEAVLFAAVGEDGFGNQILKSLNDSGVNTEHVQKLQRHVTSLMIITKSEGAYDYIPYRDADRYMKPVEKEVLNGADLIHTTAFALSRQPARTAISTTLIMAHHLQKKISVDWNYLPKTWKSHSRAQKVFGSLCRLQPLMKFSLQSVEWFLDKSLSIEEAKYFLQRLPAEVVCLTCGAEGVWFKAKDSDWQNRAVPLAEESGIDAADNFWAGFIAAYLQQQPVEAAMESGIAATAKK